MDQEYVPLVPIRKGPRRLPLPQFCDGYELREDWYDAFCLDNTRKLYGVR